MYSLPILMVFTASSFIIGWMIGYFRGMLAAEKEINMQLAEQGMVLTSYGEEKKNSEEQQEQQQQNSTAPP